MSYDHMTVSDALTKYGGEYEIEAWEAQLPQELRWFKADLAKAMYGIKFINERKRGCFVYRDNHPFVLGWIGWGAYRQSSHDESYVVSSRLVENRRYSEYTGSQYNMRFSVNRDTAVRLAKKFLRPYSPSEMASAFRTDLVRAVSNEKSSQDSKYQTTYSEVFDQPTKYEHDMTKSSLLLNELRHLVDTGHTFVNEEYGNKLEGYLKLRDSIRLNRQNHPVLDFIHVHTRFGKESVTHAAGYQLRSNTFAQIPDDTLPVCTTMEEWSENNPELAGKLAVLNMLDHNNFVEDVGFRVNEDMFYVYR